MGEEDKKLKLDSREQQLMVRSLMELRSSERQEGRSVKTVEDLVLRVIDSPATKKKRRSDHEAR